jgi:allophanate hydrolase subunit 2
VASPVATPADEVVVRAVPGPQEEMFSAAELDVFFHSTFTVDVASDRIGARLDGVRLAGRRSGFVSDGMVPGCVQVSPDGRPTVMLADGPTTGGYPKIASVVSADLPGLAQLVPGQGRVRFRRVGIDEAQAEPT